jgi:hypothetical protein
MPAASPHLAGCPRMAPASSLSLATAVSLTFAATALQEGTQAEARSSGLEAFLKFGSNLARRSLSQVPIVHAFSSLRCVHF